MVDRDNLKKDDLQVSTCLQVPFGTIVYGTAAEIKQNEKRKVKYPFPIGNWIYG